MVPTVTPLTPDQRLITDLNMACLTASTKYHPTAPRKDKRARDFNSEIKTFLIADQVRSNISPLLGAQIHSGSEFVISPPQFQPFSRDLTWLMHPLQALIIHYVRTFK